MDYDNKPDGYYTNIRYEMLKYLPLDAKKVIDIGCGNGAFAEVVQDRTGAEVWGIELMPDEAAQAEQSLHQVFLGPCEDHLDALPDRYFNVIFFNDVLEHLVDPFLVLRKVKEKLAKGGVVISSIPNVRYYHTFVKVLIEKDWKYTSHGVMDKTHLRFFTGKSIRRMYEEQGYRILTHEGINKSGGLRPLLYNIPLLFTQLDIRYLQYATVATPS